MEMSDLPKARTFKLNRAVFKCGLFKGNHELTR